MRTWLLLLVAFPTSLQAQQNIQYSVTNLLRYGNEEDRINFVVTHHDILENLTETKIAISDFQLGFRLLYDAPPEFGVDFFGIKKRYLEFRRDDLYIRAGNSFTLYGRGLALNLFENRGLAFDTGLDGIKMEYKTRMFKLGFTAGDIHYLDILDISRIEDYRIRAGSVELNPYPFLSFGFNLASGKTLQPAFPLQASIQFAQFDIPEYFGKLDVGNVDFYVAYAEKRTTVFNDTLGTHLGSAFYGSVGYTEELFGISVEYKDYRFGQAGPMQRDDRSRAKRALAFQNAPIVHKEHSFTLPSRYPHVIDFNDEVGFQVDIFYTLFSQLTGIVNFSAASRHYSYDPVDTNSIIHLEYASTPRKTNWLPTFALKYSPFWEAYTEFQYFFEEGGSDYATIAFNRRSDATANEIVGRQLPSRTVKLLQTTTVPLAVQYTIGDGWTFKFTSERQWVRDDGNVVNKKYYNHLFSLGVAKSPTFAVTLRYEFSSDFGTIDQRRDWTAIDVLYKVSNNHTVTLTVGGDRGGQVCANGVCRVVNPFLGFRASVLSYL